MEEDILESDYIEDDMNDLLEDAFTIFITTFYPERSTSDNTVTLKIDNEIADNIIETKINILRNIPQPVQRTPEWYQFRWNLITASNAWKAFESQSTINQLIYEKCQPLKNIDAIDDEEIKMVNTNTSLHWGQKYEPLSVMIYEEMYGTKVEDFGCIPHDTYKFLGASPDGIIVNQDSNRYGRMLEIKNIVNREITGIPKKEYWIQMQLQMEVCDLDECDFLETKFTEYSDEDSFLKDEIHQNENNENNENKHKNKYKGVILYFNTKHNKPFYLYKPLHITNYDEINTWIEQQIEVYQQQDMIWIKTIYWKLEKMSCVLVLRNKLWFKNNILRIDSIWKTIEKERITGYEHRAPNKRVKNIVPKKVEESTPKCLLNIIRPNSTDTTTEN